MNRRIRFPALAVSLVLIAAGCAGSDPNEAADVTSLPYVEQLPDEDVLMAAATDLTPEERSLVEFEADWICEVQNNTFESNDAIGDALDQRLADFGIDEETYGGFRERINQDEAIRAAILSTYRTACILGR